MFRLRKIFAFIFVTCVVFVNASEKSENYKEIRKWTSSGWSISKECFDFIRKVLPEGKTLLELGSGWASGQFSKFYTVYSIEDNKKWLNRYNTNYIYAPIKESWYDPEVLKSKLPKHYDLILVDGPTGGVGRTGFLKYLELFNIDVPIIFDDVHHKPWHDLMVDVANKLNREYAVFCDSFDKKFGIIFVKD